MSFDDTRSACVVRYPYLWARQAGRGETEGRKTRLVAVGVRIARPGDDDMLLLFLVTSQEPARSRFAAAIWLNRTITQAPACQSITDPLYC